MPNPRLFALLLTGLAASPLAQAQLNVRWLEFENQTSTRLVGDPTVAASDTEEKDYAWGDVDNDGDIDLVSVRKQPFTSAGRRTNVLFMNENGALVDRTSLYAIDTDVPGDQGFLTPTNDRDVVLADFNNDGWLDIATAVTISDGLPKHVSHPRIYMNKGAASGVWLGFRFQADLSPQLYVLNTDGSPNLANPQPGRFCSIGAGDVDNDGDVDLFLGDYDSSGSAGSPEPAGIDINDRLWLNDGTGRFTDSYETRMTAPLLLSAFSSAVSIADMNGDGFLDVVKDTALNPPQYVGIAYGTASGVFSTPIQQAHVFAPYFVSVGDLNNDNRLDMVVTDDNADRFRLNNGNDGLGRVIWGTATQFSFASGSDDGFGSQSLIIDLDRDGFKDVLIADVDVDIENGGSRRLHIYRNYGSVPLTLKEEVQQSGTGGWKGAVGFSNNDLLHTYNVASFDLDKDGDNDIVLGRQAGTSVWINTLCRVLPFGSPTNNSTGRPGKLSWTGNASLGEDNLVLIANDLPANAAGHFVFTTTREASCVPDGEGLRCITNSLNRRKKIPATAGRNGIAQATIDFSDTTVFGALAVGDVRYVQFEYADPAGGPAGWNWTDAIDLKVCR